MKEYHDSTGRLNIDLGNDGPMFPIYASRLVHYCKFRCIEALEGLDQRYSDFDADGATIVLHSDVFAGICIFIEDGSQDDLLRRVALAITDPNSSMNEGFAKGS